jgi:ATP-dependent DNA ligase
MQIFNIIEELRGTSSRLMKERILEKYKDNQEWRDYLVSVYNPFVVYGKSGDKNGHRDDLENLKLCRSIDAGITEVTINKVYGNIVPTFGVMKALDHDKVKFTPEFPLYAGIKYDGFNTTVVVNWDQTVTYYTSGGHPFKLEDNGIFSGVKPGMYSAEMIGINKEGKLGDRRFSAYQTTLRTNTKKGIKNTRKCNWKVFDYIPLNEFYAGEATTMYETRREYLKANIPTEFIGQEKLITSMTEFENYLEEVIQQGFEGLVGKTPEMLWRNSKKRKTDFFKWKKRPTADLLCIGEVPGEGKYYEVIGSLRLKDLSGRIVDVGIGLSDFQRTRWGDYEGKVIEIEYEQIMDTYIQPVFVTVRTDKPAWDID